MFEHKEKIESSFDGCIIDLETTGDFSNDFSDCRRYKKIEPVIFGYLTDKELVIKCRTNKEEVAHLNEYISSVVNELDDPFYAFNADFETCILFYQINQEIIFKELNSKKYEKKEDVVRSLGIEQYGDPFNGDGYNCMRAWESGNYEAAIKHNRACLLKERDILLNRGSRKPDKIVFRR